MINLFILTMKQLCLICCCCNEKIDIDDKLAGSKGLTLNISIK